MEVLTAAVTMPLPMPGPSVDDNLSRHGSVRPSPQWGGNRTRSRLPRRDCHTTRTMVRLTRQRKWRSKCPIRSCQPASGPTQQHNPWGSRGHLHQGLQVEDTHSGCDKVRCLRLDSQLALGHKMNVVSKPITHGLAYCGSRLWCACCRT